MTDISDTADLAAARLPRTLTRTQLTAVLFLVTLIPFLLVIALWFSLPSTPEPVLAADVRVGPMAWPNEGAPDARLVPCMIVKNPTPDGWRNINLSINEQFYYFHPDPLPGGGQIHIPLKFFHTKGNQFYPPEKQKLKLITVYAQTPDGARAILEVDDKQLQSQDSARFLEKQN
ncbi:MAG: hypothetical protein SFV81_22840 [Pirellulaceae bacterium]|nr:hypothetical protein [Pirellulaceae bacterium]